MFPIEIWLAYTAACILLVLAPGPDNLLAIGRGLSQGNLAASVSGAFSGIGILFHVATATFGLTLLLQTSEVAFWVIKVIGASYLIWLGFKVIRSRSLITFEPVAAKSLSHIALTAFLSAALNPKPGLFVLAFIPQFINPELGSVTIQMLVYGVWFALLTGLGFSLMGIFSSRLSDLIIGRSRIISGLNFGAGITFIVTGLSILAMRHNY
ncbi:LysE family translocator [Nitrincola alkalilacustris]|uniref:LysE family translocator n=1 Tax=Nitrincola alkalilacustris TaxID=1571224 RepID=UPI00124DB4F6|nr:LysE family translocator [Nitrincola alkalilacustris]